MPDFPGDASLRRIIKSSSGISTLAGQASISAATALSTAAVWPAANRAIYIPFELEVPATAYKMAFVVGTQSGNYDAGIYDELGNRLVSMGSTAVPAAGVAVADIADTALEPGTYFMALNIDNVIAAVSRIGVARRDAPDVRRSAAGRRCRGATEPGDVRQPGVGIPAADDGLAGGDDLMPDFPVQARLATPLFLHTGCVPESTQMDMFLNTGTASIPPAARTWVANLVSYCPIGLARPYPVQRVFWVNGSTIGSNVDFGIYTADGRRIYNTGSTARSARAPRST
jgi:hypothetical protein